MHKYNVPQRLHMVALEPWFSYWCWCDRAALAAYYAVENPGRRWILNRWGHKR